jgi:spore coat protein U-like protein
MKKLLKATAVAGLLAAGLVGQSFAGTSTGNLNVTATVNATCAVATTPVAFGAITPAASGTATATGAISAQCSNKLAYTVALSKGSGASISNRSMAGAAPGNTDTLAYNVYQDAAFSNLFGDAGGWLVAGTGNGAAQSIPVYGQLSLNQFIQPDNYSDNLTVTVSY